MSKRSAVNVVRLLVFALVCAVGLGCSTTNQQQIAVKQESSKPLEFTVGLPEPPQEPEPKLMVFGGKKQDVYLGCLNCDADEPESVFNEFGSYGSPYSPYSLWNPQAEYGSVGSPMCPLNPRATNPPVVKDQYGKFHGYLSVNNDMPQVFRSHEADLLLRHIQGN
jgi:hypothetical protein